MKIGVDLDDVLSDSMPVMADFFNEEYKTDIDVARLESDGFTSWGSDKDEAISRFTEFYLSPSFLKIKPIDGSQKAISKLSKNHKLIVITSRMELVRDLTISWINNYFPKIFDEVLFASHHMTGSNIKKSDVSKKLGIDLLIDDATHHTIDCAENGVSVILLDKPWNSKLELPKNVKRAYTWDEVVRLVES